MNNRLVRLFLAILCTILIIQAISLDNYYFEYNYTDPEDDLSYSMRFPDSMDKGDRLPYDELMDLISADFIIDNDSLTVIISFKGDLISILNTSDVNYLLNKTQEDVSFIPLPEEIDSFYYWSKLSMLSDNYFGSVFIYFKIYVRRNAFIIQTTNFQTNNSTDVILNNNNITFHYRTNDSLVYNILQQRDNTASYTHEVKSFLRYRIIGNELFTAGDQMSHTYEAKLLGLSDTSWILIAIIVTLSVLGIRRRLR